MLILNIISIKLFYLFRFLFVINIETEINIKGKRNTNTAPLFASSLKNIVVTNWKSESYLLPSIIDYDKDDYTVTATLSKNGSALPDWIQFDSRKFIISPPQGTPEGKHKKL